MICATCATLRHHEVEQALRHCATPPYSWGGAVEHQPRKITMPVNKTNAVLQAAIQCKSNECLIWPFSRNFMGYGRVKSNGAHIIVCEALKGPKPTPKHQVSHSCHNGKGGCINGQHLTWETQAENMRLRRGQSRKPRRRLTRKEHAEIVALNASGLFTHADIAAKYGLALASMYHVLNRPATRP